MERSRNSFVRRSDSPTTASTAHIPKSRTASDSFYRNLRPHQLTRLLTSHLHRSKKAKNPNSGFFHLTGTKTDIAEHRNQKEDIFSPLSEAIGLVLPTHQDAASLVHVPHLSQAAELAFKIWNTVQNNRNAKSSLQILAFNACMLVCTMWLMYDKVPLLEVEFETVGGEYGVKNVDTEAPRHLDPGMSGAEQEIENLIPQLETHSKEICSTLNEILDFVTRAASRNVVLRFFTSKSDAGKIAEYQFEIESASIWFRLELNRQIISRFNLIQQRAIQIESALVYLSAPVPPTTDSISAGVTGSSTSLAFREGSPAPPVLKGSSTTTLREFPAGAAPIPANSDYTGATFRTGNTSFPTRKAHKSTPITVSKNSQAILEADSEIIPQSSTQSPGSRYSSGDPNSLDTQDDVTRIDGVVASGGAKGNGNGTIRVTCISGDHNISSVNDQSQRSNFGNVYELDPSVGQPSASRPGADGERHGVLGRGQGGLPRNFIAALGKEAFGFGRSQTQTSYEQDATVHLGDSGMSGQRHPVRGR